MSNLQTEELATIEQQNTQIAEAGQNIQAVSPADAMLAMIDRACSDPAFDITKMERMVDMRNAEIDRVAKIDFNRAFAEMQPNLPRVISTHKNEQTKSKYAKIEDINDAVLPIISQYGFGVSFKILSQGKEGVTVQAVLKHLSGHQESTDLFMPYDKCGAKGSVNKTDIHATGSTITYAKRYAMCMLLDISTGNDTDGNNITSQFITAEQVREITDLLESTQANKIKFIRDVMGVEAIPKILSQDYKKAMNILKTKKNNQANALEAKRK